MANQLYTITSPSWDGGMNTKFIDIISPTTSFSGTDIIVSFAFDDSRSVTVGTLATMTYSVYREKRQVRTLGRISPRGVTKGPMTVAGTLIFSVINQHVVNDLRNAIANGNPAHPLANTNLKKLRMDELPPFDIILTFGNEYGQSAKMVIYGATITDEAMTFSIEDMFTENVMTYMARDVDTMRGPFSKDMSMYVQAGTALGGGAKLPKYGFDTKNLWNQNLDSYQERIKNIVDKASRDYGSSYNQPDYSGVPTPSAPSSAPSAAQVGGFADIRVAVVDGNGNGIEGVALSLQIGSTARPGVSQKGGGMLWDNLPLGASIALMMTDTRYKVVKEPDSVMIPNKPENIGGLFSYQVVVQQISKGSGTAKVYVSVMNATTPNAYDTVPNVKVYLKSPGEQLAMNVDSSGIAKFDRVKIGSSFTVSTDSKYAMEENLGTITLDTIWEDRTKYINVGLLVK